MSLHFGVTLSSTRPTRFTNTNTMIPIGFFLGETKFWRTTSQGRNCIASLLLIDMGICFDPQHPWFSYQVKLVINLWVLVTTTTCPAVPITIPFPPFQTQPLHPPDQKQYYRSQWTFRNRPQRYDPAKLHPKSLWKRCLLPKGAQQCISKFNTLC